MCRKWNKKCKRSFNHVFKDNDSDSQPSLKKRRQITQVTNTFVCHDHDKQKSYSHEVASGDRKNGNNNTKQCGHKRRWLPEDNSKDR